MVASGCAGRAQGAALRHLAGNTPPRFVLPPEVADINTFRRSNDQSAVADWPDTENNQRQ